jgi:DNA polymerase III subunit delta'
MNQVVGQHNAKQGLLRMLQSDHLPHALLITGAEGTGGLPLALAFAQYIFCSNKRDQDSCGVCSDCQKVAKLEHADLHISFPSYPPKSGVKAMSKHFFQEFREFVAQTPYGTTYEWLQYINAENKQGNISSEECRQIIDDLNLKSYEGGRKVQIIWRPEYLGKEGNILLKLIEEPPPGTLLLLVAENTEDVLATILSRSQIIRLGPIAVADIAQGLSEKCLTDPRKAAQIAHLANGSFTEALRLNRHTENDFFPDVKGWFNSIFTNNGVELSKMIDEWSKQGREQQKNFLSYVIQLLEHTIRARYMPSLPPTLPDEEAQFVRKLSGMPISFESLQEMTEQINETIYFIERNAHSKSQLLALSIKLAHAVKGNKLAEV